MPSSPEVNPGQDWTRWTKGSERGGKSLKREEILPRGPRPAHFLVTQPTRSRSAQPYVLVNTTHKRHDCHFGACRPGRVTNPDQAPRTFQSGGKFCSGDAPGTSCNNSLKRLGLRGCSGHEGRTWHGLEGNGLLNLIQLRVGSGMAAGTRATQSGNKRHANRYAGCLFFTPPASG